MDKCKEDEKTKDIIENMVTMPEERRRRSVGDRGVFRNSLVSALFRGGAENHHPLGSLPALLLPLLVGPSCHTCYFLGCCNCNEA
ncbi:hypothetical protein E2C01_098206 [Portunus trituberculatus]|uniref:Uncharacterized protein n=1 Tax=Portunus trituberculatus TaxID=210409 RepID=A0A5B7JX76_PORTR|nr:hypothetical protein [Portunus trituberculatus]